MISHKEARARFHYDPKTGALTHRGQRGRWRDGDAAGTIRNRVDAVVQVGGRQMTMARFIHFWKTGKLPKHYIDHKNGNPTDFRWRNLREATPSQNNANQRARANKSGFPGVYQVGPNKFRALLTYERKTYYLGRFPTARAAHRAYLAAKAHIHGDWSRSSRRTKAALPGIVSIRATTTRAERAQRQNAAKGKAPRAKGTEAGRRRKG